MTKKRLGGLLLDAGLINQLQLRSALAEQERWGKPLGRTLIEMEFVSERELIEVLSQQLGVPQINLEQTQISEQVARLLDEDYCRDNELLAYALEEQGSFLDVAIATPTDPSIFEQIRVKTRCNVRPHLAGPLAIEAALNRIFLGAQAAQAQESRLPPELVGETLLEFGNGDSGAEAARNALAPVDSLEVPIDFGRTDDFGSTDDFGMAQPPPAPLPPTSEASLLNQVWLRSDAR